MFRAEAIAYATYLINGSLTKSMSNKAPQEAWNGFKPSVNNLKTFSCVTYVHVPNKREKSKIKIKKKVTNLQTLQSLDKKSYYK